MASDIEIKGEVIAELEEIQDPRKGVSLLDALMIERVEVVDGEVTLVLIFEDDRPKEERWSIENEVHDALEELDEVKDINILSMTRSAVAQEQGEAAPEQGEAAPEPPGEAQVPGEVEDAPSAALDEGAGGGLSVYSGGGCGAGTVAAVSVQAPASKGKAAAVSKAPASKAAAVATVGKAPVAAVSAAVGKAPVAAVSAAGKAPVAAVSAAVGAVGEDGQVVLSLEAYTRLIQAERECQLRPSVEEHSALLARHRVLQGKVSSLQDAVRGLLGGLEGALSE